MSNSTITTAAGDHPAERNYNAPAKINARATRTINTLSWVGIVPGAALAAATIYLINFDAPLYTLTRWSKGFT